MMIIFNIHWYYWIMSTWINTMIISVWKYFGLTWKNNANIIGEDIRWLSQPQNHRRTPKVRIGSARQQFMTGISRHVHGLTGGCCPWRIQMKSGWCMHVVRMPFAGLFLGIKQGSLQSPFRGWGADVFLLRPETFNCRILPVPPPDSALHGFWSSSMDCPNMLWKRSL